MVPMGMGKKKIKLRTPLFAEMVSQSSDTGSGVNNNDIIAIGPDFNTGGITAVFDVLFSRNRNRPSWPPAFYIHDKPFRPVVRKLSIFILKGLSEAIPYFEIQYSLFSIRYSIGKHNPLSMAPMSIQYSDLFGSGLFELGIWN